MFEPLEAEIVFGHYVQGFSSNFLDVFFQTITWLGNPVFWIFLAALLYWAGEEKKGFFLSLNVLIASAAVGFLKIITGRIRPSSQEFRVLDEFIESKYSLPSGHATTIASIFGYLWEKTNRYAKTGFLILALIVMTSRVYLGVHYLGDVLVGALFGFLIGRLVHVAEQKYEKIKFSQKVIIEEAGLATIVLASLLISLVLREFSLAMLMLGFFAGMFGFKMLEFDQAKAHGKKLFAKIFAGTLTLGLFWIFAGQRFFEAEVLFTIGLWMTLFFPLIWERLAEKKSTTPKQA